VEAYQRLEAWVDYQKALALAQARIPSLPAPSSVREDSSNDGARPAGFPEP